MRKHTRITSLILALALVFGTLSLNVFATEAEAAAASESTSIPEAKASWTVADIDALAAAGTIEKALTSTIDPEGKDFGFSQGPNPGGNLTALETYEGSGDYYVSYGKNTTGASGDAYLQVSTPTNTRNQTLAGYDTYRGKSFIVSLDVRLTEHYSETYTTGRVLFTFGSWMTNASTSSTLKTNVLSIKADGSFSGYSGGTVVSESAPKLTPGAEEFTKISVFVKPETNTYDFYLDGVMVVKDAKFLSNTSLVAGIQINDTTVSTENDYMPSFVRIFQGTPYSSITSEIIGLDNIKFYYADYFVECAEHDFAVVGGEHTHDFENGTIKTAYECTNCYYAYDKTVSIDADSDTKCDACIAAVKENAPYHSFDNIQADITAAGGSISKVESFDALGSVNDKAGNMHILNDSWGENYLSVGNTTDATQDLNTYKNIYLNNSVNFSNIKSNETRGKAFVLQIDLKLEEGFNKALDLYEIATYVRDAISNGATDESGVKSDVLESYPSSGTKSLKNRVLSVTADGYIKAGNYGVVSDFKLSYDKFTTVAVHLEPSENKFSIYADGVCVIKDVTLFSWDNIDQMTFENADGSVKVEGPNDYILGYWRFFQNSINSSEYLLSTDNAIYYYADDYAATYAPKYHDHTLKAVTDEGNGYYTFTYKCDECADVYSVVGTGKALTDGVVITGRSASLGEYIGFKLHAEITDAIAGDETATIVITVGDTVQEYALSDIKDYAFNFALNSTQMTETITAQLISADGESEIYTTSFADYAESLIAASDNAALVNLLKSTLNYGAYAQDYFAEKNDLTFDTAPNKYYDEAALDTAASALKSSHVITAPDGAPAPSGTTLILDSKIDLKIFVSGDATKATLGGTELQLKTLGNEKYVVIEGLMPQELDDKITVVFENGTASSEVTISVVDCAALVVENASMSDAFKNLAKALYVYNNCANEYLATLA